MAQSDPGKTLGHLAVEQRLLNRNQLRHCREVLARRQTKGEEAGIGEIMLELGYITRQQLTAVRAEIRRQQCCIRGYEMIEKVGAGSVGTVYRAKQTAMDRTVAVKILHPQLAENQRLVAEYISEARAVAKLNHPHLVQGIDVGESDGMYYFAMEFLGGGTLADILDFAGPLQRDQALIYLYQVASALEHAWQKSIIHCDIKPANLMLDEAKRLKVTDLGLAQIGAEGAGKEADGKRVVRGTPHYISPEQIRDAGNLDCRTDIYSLGATFYHLFTGMTPFTGRNNREVILKRLRRDPEPAHEHFPDLGSGIGELLQRMMARDPDNRPATPKEVMTELMDIGVDPVAAGDVVGGIKRHRSTRRIKMRPPSIRRGRRQKQPTTPNPEARPRRRYWIALTAILLIAIMALIAWAVFQ